MNWLIRAYNTHPDLINSELNSLATDLNFKQKTNSIFLVEAEENQLLQIKEKSATLRYIIKSPILINLDKLLNATNADDINLKISNKSNSTFCVRYFHSGERIKKHPSEVIERKVGSWILKLNTKLQVNLQNPSIKYYITAWDNEAALGWLYTENKYSSIAWREPKKAPFMRGGNMKPLLVKILVNLLYPLDPVVIDPFCGHGGFLREISEHEVFAVGIEVSKKVIRECKANNYFFDYQDTINLIMGDALKPPLRKKSVVMYVTDPPYAIQTTTKGLGANNLLKQWLANQEIGIKVVFTTPKLMLENLNEDWICDLDHNDYVHKALTRRIRRVIKVK